MACRSRVARSTAAPNTDSDPHQPVLSLERFSYAYPDASDWVLREVSLRIEPGQCHLLEGPTGSGKTTLLLAIRDLLPTGRRAGTIRVAAPASARGLGAAGLVQQNPKTQLLGANLGADVAFGLENHCVEPSEMPERVREALEVAGLRRPLHLPTEALSMGQQYRACLAGLLVMNPALVMMDEPMAQLDPRGREKTLAVIRDLKRRGRAVLICEHRPDALLSVADHRWHLDERGSLKLIPPTSIIAHDASSAPGNTQINVGASRKPPAFGLPPRSSAGKGGCIARVAGLRFDNGQAELDLSALSFSVSRGERIAVCGPNGSGKTTLIRALAGLANPSSGTVEVLGAPPRLTDMRGRMALLFQDPRKQIFEGTVFEEVAFSARRRGIPAESIDGRVNGILEDLGLAHLGARSPHQLSYGQKHLVGLAAALAGAPEILLLDDPFAGLDPERIRFVMRQITRLTAARTTTIIWTSHDPEILGAWADRRIDLTAAGAASSTDVIRPVPSECGTFSALETGRIKLNTGVMLALCLTLSMLAFVSRTPVPLIGLTAVNLLLIIACHPRPLRFFRKSAGLFFWQAALVVLLYGIRFGLRGGLAPGLAVAWQLFLAFWPGMTFMASNSQPRIVRTLSRVLPQRTAFVTATCLRFLPLLLAEMQQIREAQVLRGARILAADLKTPRYWPDWLRCLLVPTLIKTLSLAGEIATAAKARDFGIHPRRTTWPGD
jgi:energy-coupling factor transporter ATP-binding protein EcfA2/energy-coupling factor transporter transmembrane protein EcfT